MTTTRTTRTTTCRTCGKRDTKHIRAMSRAGFAPRHLACRGCGAQL